MKKIYKIIIVLVMIIPLLLGIGLSIPGPGSGSLQFINSVKKEIDHIFPKGKFVLDGKNAMFKFGAQKAIETSYIADAISTLDFGNEKDMDMKDEISKYADEVFKKDWQDSFDNKKDIDLHEVGYKLIDLDKDLATKYHTYGFVHSGISWMFHENGIKQIFSKDVYNDAEKQEKTIDQETYNNLIKANKPNLMGIKVSSSIGSYITNNKVWFLNLQIANAKFAMKPPLGGSLFKDKKLTVKDLDYSVTVNDLKTLNFTSLIKMERAGVVIFFIGIFTFVEGGAFLILKKMNPSKNNN